MPRTRAAYSLPRTSTFLRLHAEGRPHAGIAFFPQGRPSPGILQKLVLLHAVLNATEMLGQVEYL